jgi:hypothetical protein
LPDAGVMAQQQRPKYCFAFNSSKTSAKSHVKPQSHLNL